MKYNITSPQPFTYSFILRYVNIQIMLNCTVVDDAPHASDLIRGYIEKTPFLSLVSTFKNPIEALSFLQKEKVDLIFLDMHMPELTGIEFLKILGGKAKVIITSAHAEYAIEGYEHEVVDYLLKPVPFDRFFRAVQKAFLGTNISADAHAEGNTPFILVKTETRGKMMKVDTASICYVEGLKNYVSIYTCNQRIVALLNIKDLEKRLPSNHFLRVHKSYIVNIDKINAIENSQLLLKDMQSAKNAVPLGVTYRDTFYEMFKGHIMDRK